MDETWENKEVDWNYRQVTQGMKIMDAKVLIGKHGEEKVLEEEIIKKVVWKEERKQFWMKRENNHG